MKDYLYKVITDQVEGFPVVIIRFFLFILSQIYSLLIKIQNYCYSQGFLKPASVDVFVISVGNITWGGTGKTSFIQLLVEHILAKGKTPTILIRGYKKAPACPAGRQNPKLLPVRQAGKTQSPDNYQLMGDEAYLLKEKFPAVTVLVGRDRVASARKAVGAFNCDYLLLDDGFQHRRLGRNLDIVLIDCLNPFGNGYLIPRGILREPIQNLERANIIVMTNCEFDKQSQKQLWFMIKNINDNALIVYVSYRFKGLYELGTKKAKLISEISGQRVGILASIGNFNSFKLAVDKFLEVKLEKEFNFPDHHEYSDMDLETVVNASKQANLNMIITTEKDAVRLKSKLDCFEDIELLVLEVRLEIIENSQKFFDCVDNVLIN
jgi:tetraacyldisaccharide 4'-kinase